MAGQFLPCYGDAADARGWRGDLVAEYRSEYERAYLHWQSDLLAWKLFRLGKRDPGLWDVDLWDALAAHVERLGPEPPAQSRVFDGVGMAFLEARRAEPALQDRAGLTLRYGYGWGHSHHDNLNVEFWAKNQPVVPELGYPTWVHPLGGTAHTVHHVTGMIDHAGQYSGATGKGTLEMFAAAPEASFVDCSAQPTGFPAWVYCRAVALLEAPGENSYVFDVLRLAGGTVRTYCFHGPPYDGFQCALPFGEKGEPLFTNLLEPQTAASGEEVVADWKYQRQPFLPSCAEKRGIVGLCRPPPTYGCLCRGISKASGRGEGFPTWEPGAGGTAWKECRSRTAQSPMF